MLSNASPATDGSKPLSMHGSASPETTRPTIPGKSRSTLLHYPSPTENMSSPFSPATSQSTSTFPGSASSSTAADFNVYPQTGSFVKRSNSDHSLPVGQAATSRPTLSNANRTQRHSSFSVIDVKPADALVSRPPLQPGVGSYGSMSASGNKSFPGNTVAQSVYVSQQNFTPFTLPPPGFSSMAATTSPRDAESSYAISSPNVALPLDYQQRDPGPGQQSGPDMMLLDQMTAPNTMPVFGGEGYSRSPFAIPDDFVAYLFSGQQFDSSSSMAQSGIGQQGYAK